MMQLIREKAQGIVAWVIVAIVAFVLCFWGVSGYVSNDNAKVLAKVNDRKITTSEVNEIYNRWLRFSTQQKDFDLSQVNPESIKKEITTAIAQQTALVSSMQKLGMFVSDAMVVDNIRSKPNFQEDGKFSINLYKQFLQQLSLSEGEYEAAVRDELLMNQLQLSILASSFYTTQEASRIIAIKDQSRDFGYTVIPATRFVKAAEISDSEIEDFYNTHKHQFMVQDTVRVEYIELSLEDLMKSVPVNEAKLQEYYKDNSQSFNEPRTLHLRHIMIADLPDSDSQSSTTSAARNKIDKIYTQLQSGANFVELAKKYSDDKQSAARGGDLGLATNNDNYPPAVFALQKNGDYTTPIQSDYGWHIFQLVNSKGGGVRSFAAVRDIVIERYKHHVAEKLFSSKGEELASLAFENPASLLPASEKLGLPIKTSDYFTKQGGSGIAESSNVLRAAFSEDVFVQQHNSELIRMNDDTYLVLRVKNKELAHEKPLADARKEILSYLQRNAARDGAKHIGDELLAAIKQVDDPAKAAHSKNLVWEVKRQIYRDNSNINRDILQQVFLMPKLESGQKFVTKGFSLPNGDYVVIALTKVKDGAVNNTADYNLIETVGKQVATLNGRLQYYALQKSLIDQTKIKYYN